MLLTIHIPNEPFGSLVRSKEAGPLLGRLMEHLKPEASYFCEQHGQRTGMAIIDVSEASQIPGICEPFFLHLDAECELRPVKTAEDLAKADLDGIADKWA
jgi:hypothetical protein